MPPFLAHYETLHGPLIGGQDRLSISNSILSNLADSVYIFGGLIQSLDQKGLLNKNKLALWIAKGDRATLQRFLERTSVNLIKIKNPTFVGLKILAQHKMDT